MSDETEPGASAPASAPVADHEQIVREWFNEHVANSPVSRNVEALNHMALVAIPALVARLNSKG